MAVEVATRIIAWAELREGKREQPKGSNDAPWLRKDLGPVGFYPGAKWCLFFAMGAWQAAACEVGKAVKFINRTGNCQGFYEVHKRLGHVYRDISTGSIVLYRDREGHHYHAGICLGAGSEPDTIRAIEGNTSGKGDPDGNAVHVHERHIEVCDFVVPSLYLMPPIGSGG